jgi:hypothetical protein
LLNDAVNIWGVFYCSLLYISRISSDEASKKMNLDLFWRYSEEEAIKHDKFKYSKIFFFILDDITEVSNDLLENSVMSDHSKDTTVIMCSVLALMQV